MTAPEPYKRRQTAWTTGGGTDGEPTTIDLSPYWPKTWRLGGALPERYDAYLSEETPTDV